MGLHGQVLATLFPTVLAVVMMRANGSSIGRLALIVEFPDETGIILSIIIYG
jgi:hypothetical protein